jgi:hypothetical protein
MVKQMVETIKILKPIALRGLRDFLPANWRPVWFSSRSPQKGVAAKAIFFAHTHIITLINLFGGCRVNYLILLTLVNRKYKSALTIAV